MKVSMQYMIVEKIPFKYEQKYTQCSNYRNFYLNRETQGYGKLFSNTYYSAEIYLFSNVIF
jgi:hypothetical protein